LFRKGHFNFSCCKFCLKSLENIIFDLLAGRGKAKVGQNFGIGFVLSKNSDKQKQTERKRKKEVKKEKRKKKKEVNIENRKSNRKERSKHRKQKE
jgi:hypothetical protein